MFRYFLLIFGVIYSTAVNYAADPLRKPGEPAAAPVSAPKPTDTSKSQAPNLAPTPPVSDGQKGEKINRENRLKPGVQNADSPAPAPDGSLIAEKHVPKSPTVSSFSVNELTFPAHLNQAVSLAASEQFNSLVLYLGIYGLVGLIVIVGSIYFFSSSNNNSSSVQPVAGPTTQDINNFIKACEALKLALPSQGKSASSHQFADSRSKIQPSFEDSFIKLLPRISADVVKALHESEGEGLKAQIVKKDAELAEIESDHGRLSRQVESLKADLVKAQADADEALSMIDPTKNQNERLTVQLTEALRSVEIAKKESENERLKSAQLLADNEASALTVRDLQAVVERLTEELNIDRISLEKARVDLSIKHEEIDRLSDKVRRGYDSLVPAKLSGTELAPQVEVLHQEAIAGNTSAVSAWSALTSFGAAQLDPVAKDFQLQIVRRLGVVLVQYWKQKGLSERERHEHLSSWAKQLNEHADGRYNLFVPGLGAPIDKTRMVSASGGATVCEVLCWQIRNPAGANFMLAEVA